MRVFVDTSALFALLDASDRFHKDATEIFKRLAQQSALLITTNYVVVETIALLQSRLGIQAVEDFVRIFKPLLTIVWVAETTHQNAEIRLLAMGRRRVSLVDCVSFETMQEQGISLVFANDQHFQEAGFTALQP